MGLTLLTPATVFPVTLTEAKAQCRVTHDDEDDYITGLIAAATRYVEQNLSASIAEQEWKLTLDEFADTIELPRGPVTSVDSVEYVDANGDTQTASTSLYTVDLSSRSPWIVRNSDASWPATMAGINMVSITYTAGMGTVPDDIKHAIQVQIQLLYERGADPKIAEYQERAIASLLQSYRWVLA